VKILLRVLGAAKLPVLCRLERIPHRSGTEIPRRTANSAKGLDELLLTFLPGLSVKRAGTVAPFGPAKARPIPPQCLCG
jgi:hypothetical protein